MLLTASGAVATGLSPSVRRCIDGTFAAGGGTATEDGSTGSYKYAMAQADTNGNDISLIFTATGAMPVCINFVTTAADPTNATTFGITDIDAAISSRMATYTQPTGFLAATFPSGTVANTTNITSITGNITGNLSGSVGSVTGAVGSVTGAVGSVTGNVGGNVVGSVASVTARVTANADQVNGNATAAANVAHSMQAITRGTCSGGTTATAIVSTLTSPSSLGAVGQLIGRTILFDADTTTTNLRGQASNITDSTTGATPTITFTAMTDAPANGDTFSIL